MSGKRAADVTGASGGTRHFKQTKLNFFTSAQRSQAKKPRPVSGRHEETPTTTAKATESEPNQSSNISDNTTAEASDINTQIDTPDESQPQQQPSTGPAPAPAQALAAPVTTPSSRIRITDRTGDLFDAPASTLLIHACNSVGSWGGGIALAFRNLYPAEFKVYRAHCAKHTPRQLVGTALLIPPQSPPNQGKGNGNSNGRGRGHYIGCLFTSRGYGSARDPPERILRATGPAMRDLMRRVAAEEERSGVRIGEVRMCRINSGLFAVPWGRSKAAVEEIELGEGEVPRCVSGGVVEVVAWERE